MPRITTNDTERLDWLDSEEGVMELIAACTIGLPANVEKEIDERKLDRKNLSIRDLIDMLAKHT